MRKNIIKLTALAVILFLGACSNQDEILTEKDNDSEHTITLTASMPDEPTTYVALNQAGKNINLTWQEGDRLQFAIVQGAIKVKVVTPLAGKITNNGKTVSFTITLPTGIGFDQNADFDLYGLYGFESATPEEGGLSTANPTNVILTKTPGSRGTLERVQNRGDVMLYFKETGINMASLPESVTFNHLGSLFAISFNNTVAPSATSGITEARLVGVNTDGTPLTGGNWAFNNGAGGQIFDMLTEQFQDIATAGNYISFTTAGGSFAAGNTTTLWAWYPPIPEQAWPALRLEMTDANGDEVIASANIKQARATAPVAGKAYHFYARWNGTVLNLTNDQYVPVVN